MRNNLTPMLTNKTIKKIIPNNQNNQNKTNNNQCNCPQLLTNLNFI